MAEVVKASRMKLEVRGEIPEKVLEGNFAKARGEKRASMFYYYDPSKDVTVVHLYPVRIIDEFTHIAIDNIDKGEIWRSLIYFEKSTLPFSDYRKFIQEEFCPFREEQLEMVVALTPYDWHDGRCRFELITTDTKRLYDPSGKIPKQFLVREVTIDEQTERLKLAKEWILDTFEEYVSVADSAKCPAAKDMDEISALMVAYLSRY
jgi:hypothetical protein